MHPPRSRYRVRSVHPRTHLIMTVTASVAYQAKNATGVRRTTTADVARFAIAAGACDVSLGIATTHRVGAQGRIGCVQAISSSPAYAALGLRREDTTRART